MNTIKGTSLYDQGMADATRAIFHEMNETAYLLYAAATRAAQKAGEVTDAILTMGHEYNGAAKMCVLVSMKMRKQEPTDAAVDQEMLNFAAVNMKRYRKESGQ